MVDEPLPRQASDPADVAAYVASLATDVAILTHKAGLTTGIPAGDVAAGAAD
jgi:hypothetical protein